MVFVRRFLMLTASDHIFKEELVEKKHQPKSSLIVEAWGTS
jgi:choline kinase